MRKNTIFKRVLASMFVGILSGFALSEITFLFLRDSARAPETIEIVIPEGTAELVARGEQPPDIPEDMVFVAGDTLVLKNEDSVAHQLGPIWVPAGASGQIVLGKPENLSFECSFQPGNYIGLDIREPLNVGTRIYGILFAGIPLGILLSLYAVIMPKKSEESK